MVYDDMKDEKKCPVNPCGTMECFDDIGASSNSNNNIGENKKKIQKLLANYFQPNGPNGK